MAVQGVARWGVPGMLLLAALVGPAAGVGAAVVEVYVSTASLNASTYEGCRINDSGALAVTMYAGVPVSFHFRGVLNDVHGTRDDAVWDAATLLPLGFFCRFGEIAEHLAVERLEVDCIGRTAYVEAYNEFFRNLEISASGGVCQ